MINDQNRHVLEWTMSMTGIELPEEYRLWQRWDMREEAALSPPDTVKNAIPAIPSVPSVVDVSLQIDLPPPLLMTMDEFASRVGHAPHKDRMGGLWKRSTQYKSLEREHLAVQALIDAKSVADLSRDRKAIEMQIAQMIAAAELYMGRTKDRAKQSATRDLIASARNYIANLTAVTDDPSIAAISDHITIDEAHTLLAQGIDLRYCTVAEHSDSRLDQSRTERGFASGAVSEVSKLVYQSGTAHIFKREVFSEERLKPGARHMGIDHRKPRYGYRNIASRLVSDVLETSVIPEASFAFHNGELGLVMGVAQGTSPRVKEWETMDDQEAAEREPAFNHRNTCQKKVDGIWMRPQERLKIPWSAPPSPQALASLQKSLNALEWTDLVSGQIDRHSANYFVAIHGDKATVTGIDNDFSFGADQTALPLRDTKRGITSAGAPRLIDRHVLDRLRDCDFDRDMASPLQGLLTAQEINATRARFDAAVALARRLEAAGCVVDDWNTWRSSEVAPRSAADYLGATGSECLYYRDLVKPHLPSAAAKRVKA